MKAKIITGLKKEVLVIEAKSKDIACGFIFNKYGVKELLKWELLGKPDEIKEEDVIHLVEDKISGKVLGSIHLFSNKEKKTWSFTALKSFFSAIEKEIYWVNPNPKLSGFMYFLPSINEGVKLQKKFDEAQEKTFDRNRTLIFVKK